MAFYRNILIALTLGVILIFNHEAMAQERRIKYNIRVLGMDVGVLTVTEQVNGRDTIIEAITDVKVRIIFTFRIKYEQKSTYQAGELLNSSLLTYKKDNLNSSTYLIRKGDGYILIKDEDTSFVRARINYSGSLLYFHEPSDIVNLYYEINGEKKPIKQIGGHKYQVIDPENGRESIFEYEDGILQCTSIEHRLATIYTERLQD